MSKTGRPSVDTEPVTLRLPRDILDALERYRREQDSIPTRPEAVRQMMRDWLVGHGYLKIPPDQDDAN